MKVLFAPLNYGNIKQDGMCDAFVGAGCDLKVFDYFAHFNSHKNLKHVREHFVNTARSFKPDLVHLQVQHTNILDEASVRRIKQINPNTIITNWTGDVRNYIPPTYKKVAKAADYNLISSTGQIESFKKALVKNVRYWQTGYNPKLYYPNLDVKYFEFDCVFIGNCDKREKYPGAKTRIDACRLLQREFGKGFKLHGAHWPKELVSSGSVDQRSITKIYHRSTSLLNISHYNDLGHYFSDRLLMCMASGRPVISLAFPGWQSYFTHMADIIIVDDIKEIPNMVHWCKNNPEHATFIGRSGAAKVFAEHTYYSRVLELLEIVGLQ